MNGTWANVQILKLIFTPCGTKMYTSLLNSLYTQFNEGNITVTDITMLFWFVNEHRVWFCVIQIQNMFIVNIQMLHVYRCHHFISYAMQANRYEMQCNNMDWYMSLGSHYQNFHPGMPSGSGHPKIKLASNEIIGHPIPRAPGKQSWHWPPGRHAPVGCCPYKLSKEQFTEG